MKKNLLWLIFLLLGGQAAAQTAETPNFSILGQVGMGECTGYLGNGNPAPGGGLWLGIGLSDRFDGLWGIDYFTMPNQEITVPLTPTLENPATSMLVQPTDDISLTINVRWYWASKYDRLHQRFNTVPYLIAGVGMDMVVDEDPRPPGTNLFGASFDALFALNLGVGMDFPLGDGKQWFLYGEGLDHMIAWQGLTQIYSVRAGFKVMLDSAHVDPFRGLF
ncbi:MAG TPA: hypothetical protein VK859_14895 [bacterium]|nr:hypothetical protein [bacterium]